MYKIIRDNKIIDVIKHPKFIKFLANGHIAMTDKNSANGLVGSDGTLYSFKAVPAKSKANTFVTIAEIDDIEFSRLSCLLNSNSDVSADESALAKAKRDKLLALSGNCKNKITAGFTIELSDGKEHSFRLTVEDQLNLMLIENQMSTDEAYFVYHATNEPCRIYSRDDMYRIVKAFRSHVLYHTTYYNAAKQYIGTITDIEKVNLFSYGTDVSSVVENRVLKQILKTGG